MPSPERQAVKKAEIKLVRHIDDIEPLQYIRKSKRPVNKEYAVSPDAHIQRQKALRTAVPSKKAEAAETEQSDDIFGGIKSYRQRIADKQGSRAGSLFQKSGGHRSEQNERAEDELDLKGSPSSSSGTSDMRTEITDSDPESKASDQG